MELNMNIKISRSFPFIVILVSLAVFALLLFQQNSVISVKAQSPSCTDPLTGAQCTPTPPARCGVPGLPDCPSTQPNNTPTKVRVVIYRPTITPTPVPTITPIPTATLVPTATFVPTFTKVFVPPVLQKIPNLISKFGLPQGLVSMLPPWMQPDNIKVTDIEITQAIQCLHNPSCPDNSVPL
jgi:hypothetical protein